MRLELVVKKYSLFLGIIILMTSRFCYILPENFGISILNCENIAVGLAALFTFFVALKYRGSSTHFKYGWLVLIGLLLAVTSSFQGSDLYSGQNFLDGISCQKYLIVGLIMYFPITILIKQGELEFTDVIRVLRICAILQIIIYGIQYLAGSNHIFLSCYYTTPSIDSRVVRIRLYGYTYPIITSLAFCMNRIVNNEKWKGDYLYVVATILFAVFINQGRSYIVNTAVVIIVILIVAREQSLKRMGFILVAVLAIAVIYSSDFGQELISELLNTTVDSSNTIAVRYRAQELYLSVINSHPFFGGGYADTSVASAAAQSGYNSGYYIADNGVIGFLFRYGLCGLALLVPLVLIFLSNGLKLRKYGEYVALTELCVLVAGYINNSTWYDGFGLFYIFIYIIYIESTLDTIEQSEAFNEELNVEI